MSASQGMHSAKTYLFAADYGTANPEGTSADLAGFTQIAEVISINGLPMNPSVTKLTHLDSDDLAHEKIPGFLDAGQISFKVNQTNGAVSGKVATPALIALAPAANRSAPDWGRKQWVVQFPNGDQWYATGFIQGHPIDVPEDDRLTLDFTVEVSGRPVFTEVA